MPAREEALEEEATEGGVLGREGRRVEGEAYPTRMVAWGWVSLDTMPCLHPPFTGTNGGRE